MKKVVLIVVSVVLLVCTISITSLYFLVNNALNVEKNSMEIPVFEEYEIPSYKAKIFGKNIKVKIKDNINKDKIGDYKITYEISYIFKAKKGDFFQSKSLHFGGALIRVKYHI